MSSTNGLVRVYLLVFNLLSAVGWAYVLFLTVRGVAARDAGHRPLASTNKFSTYLDSLLFPCVPPTYDHSSSVLAPVQSLAALEVLHVLLRFVRSPLPTTFIQVSSRLILVWAILARFSITHSSPIYTTMVLAWSLTEVPRYSYYALGLLGLDAPAWLTWLRYSTFYVLYPLGAGSEALVVLSTIPEWQNGRYLTWAVEDVIKAAMVFVWIPGLYVMYTHMIHTRRKVLGHPKGLKLGAKPKDRKKAD